MRIKLAICAAVLHDPAYLLLDEPFSSLDPVSAAELVTLLRELRQAGKAILVSSHNLAQVEQIASHVGVIDSGKLLFGGTLEEFTKFGGGSVERSLLKMLGAQVASAPIPSQRMMP
jgi:ABC-2 type transport system ATP-binding protein